ncbi:MAG: flagellar export chaperone FliS [Candidatus Hydrogenedentes bacterium]|nr:flagellar export chaperone FliS [Candidatus Hydrogenedentota bacterium]
MSHINTPTKTYKEVTVNTASQGKLILMLFDGAIKRAEEAIRHIENNNIEFVHKNLIRAQEIIAELRSSLNMEVGGEISKNLDKIYEYIHYLLVQGNLKKDSKPIKESIEYMKSMRDTWKEAFDIYHKEIANKTNTESQDVNLTKEKTSVAPSKSAVDLSV